MRLKKLRRIRKTHLVRAILCLLGLAVLVLTAPVDSYAFNTAVIDWAIRELCGHITGYLGALLTAVSVLGAIVSAAMGSYRVFFGAIIVAIGAFATPDIVTLYFPEAGAQCSGAQQSGRAGKSNEVMQSGVPSTEVNATNLKLPSALVQKNTLPDNSQAPKAETQGEDDDAEISRSWGNLSSEE